MSFQGEPGVRGPPGPSGPRGIGTQGPKVSLQVCTVCDDQGPSVTTQRHELHGVHFGVDLFGLDYG